MNKISSIPEIFSKRYRLSYFIHKTVTYLPKNYKCSLANGKNYKKP